MHLPDEARPKTPTLITISRSDEVVSPPNSGTLYLRLISSYPFMNRSTHSPCASFGRAIDRKVATGIPPMAAISLRFTAAAFQPTSSGEDLCLRKCTPSTSKSVENSSSPSPEGTTAQSSPIPMTPSGWLKCPLMNSISPNSPLGFITNPPMILYSYTTLNQHDNHNPRKHTQIRQL